MEFALELSKEEIKKVADELLLNPHGEGKEYQVFKNMLLVEIGKELAFVYCEYHCVDLFEFLDYEAMVKDYFYFDRISIEGDVYTVVYGPFV